MNINTYASTLDPSALIPSFPYVSGKDIIVGNTESTTTSSKELEKRIEELEQQVKKLTNLLIDKTDSEQNTDLGFIVCDLEK